MIETTHRLCIGVIAFAFLLIIVGISLLAIGGDKNFRISGGVLLGFGVFMLLVGVVALSRVHKPTPSGASPMSAPSPSTVPKFKYTYSAL